MLLVALLFACKSDTKEASPGTDVPEETGAGTTTPPTDDTDTSTTPSGPTALFPVEADRYEADVKLLAVDRGPGTPGWQAAQNLCAERFTEYGYDVDFHTFDEGTNVIGRKPGSGDGTVVLSAHYDSVPGCEGADDNATGVAGVLELARVLRDVPFEQDLVFACWDQEEAGLLGSIAWVTDTTDDITMAFSLETIGFYSEEPNSQILPFGLDIIFPDETLELATNEYRGDFITWVGDTPTTTAAEAFEGHAGALMLPVIPLILNQNLVDSPLTADLKRSDHAPFWVAGHPAVMLTDSADFRNEAYHCQVGEDTVDKLDLEIASNVIEALAKTVDGFAR